MTSITVREGAFPEYANKNTMRVEADKGKSLWDRAAANLDSACVYLDEKMPNLPFQNRADEWGRKLEAKFSKLEGFNRWLDESGKHEWYKEMGLFLAKLPLKVGRNIARLLYGIVKTALYSAVHPVKAVVKLAKMLVRLAEALSKAETYTRIGAGIIGGSLGQFAISGNAFALMGMAIGGGLMLGGMAAGAISAAVRQESIKEELVKHLKAIPESVLTGFAIGLLVAEITHAVNASMPCVDPHRLSEAQISDWMRNNFLPQHDLPSNTPFGFLGDHSVQILGSKQSFLYLCGDHFNWYPGSYGIAKYWYMGYKEIPVQIGISSLATSAVTAGATTGVVVGNETIEGLTPQELP